MLTLRHVPLAPTMLSLLLCITCFGMTSLAQSPHNPVRLSLQRIQGERFLSQKSALDEARELNRRANELHAQGQYDAALPLAERAVNIFEKALGTEHPAVAIALNNLGHLYQIKGDYPRAEPIFLRALAINEKVLGATHPDVARALNDLALVYQDKGDFRRAEPLHLRALTIYEKAFGAEHQKVAISLNNVAEVYRVQGDYARAEPLYLRALNIYEKVLGVEHPDTTIVINNLAVVYQDKGDYTRAEQMFLRALANNEKALGAEHLQVAISLNNLADLYRFRGDYARAEPLYLRALNVFEKAMGTDHPNVAATLNNLALLYQTKGDYAHAEPMFLRALAIQEKALGAEHPNVALSLSNFARMQHAKGDYARAEPLYLRALNIYEKALGVEHPEVARALNNLGVVYRATGDYARAEPLYLRALAINERALGAVHPLVAPALTNLAETYRAKGDYARAEPMFLRALNIYEKALGAEHPDVGVVTNDLAALYQTKGDYARAEPLYLRALAITEKALGVEHPEVATSLSNLAVLYQTKGDYRSAIRLLTRSADIREYNLSLLLSTGSENQKRAYAATLVAETDFTISLHIHSTHNIPEGPRLALTTILRRKGRTLDAMTDQIAGLRRRLDPQDRALLDELSQTNSQLAVLTLKGPGQIDPAQHRTQIARLESEKERLEAQVSARSMEFRAQAQTVTLKRVQQAIPTGAAMVEIVSYEPFNAQSRTQSQQWGEMRYAAYMLRREGEPTFVDLGEAAPINQAVSRFLSTLANSKSTGVKQAARALDELTMRPVRKLLGETRMVLLSPDGELNLIPFAALVDEQGRYLVESYTFNYLTSGRDLLRLEAQSQQQRQQPVVIANPTFDLAVTTSNQKVTENDAASGRRSLDFNTLRISPLPGTAQEAAAIKSIVPSAQLFTESAATEAALKNVAGPRLLHIATHGFFLKDQPPQTAEAARRIKLDEAPRAVQGENPLLRSGLLLAGVTKGQSGAGEDGVLTALEAAGLDLWGTKLVVLSACDTGVGQVANGDGVYGLRRALVLAGAESQLMSLWQVSDTATRDLMIDYYRQLERGEGRTEALRAAQLAMLINNKQKGQAADRGIFTEKGSIRMNRSHPYYWASFIPIGDWRPINKVRQRFAEKPLQPASSTLRPVTMPNPSDEPRLAPVPRATAAQTTVAINTAAERNPDSLEALMRAAADFYKSGKVSEAASYLERVLALNPNDVDALAMMGNVRYDTGDFVGAATFFQRYLALRPDNAAVRADLGNTYFYQASPDYNAAITEYRKALKISPKDERVWHNLAVTALHKKGELTARDAINQLAEINPSNPNLAMLRSALASLVSVGKQVSFDEAVRVVTMHR